MFYLNLGSEETTVYCTSYNLINNWTSKEVTYFIFNSSRTNFYRIDISKKKNLFNYDRNYFGLQKNKFFLKKSLLPHYSSLRYFVLDSYTKDMKTGILFNPYIFNFRKTFPAYICSPVYFKTSYNLINNWSSMEVTYFSFNSSHTNFLKNDISRKTFLFNYNENHFGLQRSIFFQKKSLLP